MQALSLSDILPIEAFVADRRKYEARILEVKAARRVALGPNMVFCFENRDTIWWQIQEMCRVEGIRNEAGILHELQTYTALLPTPTELSATLLIGYPEPAERDRMLKKLVGLHQALFLRVGEAKLPFQFDQGQFEDARISSVQFVRVALLGSAFKTFTSLSTPVSIHCTHPAYLSETLLSRSVRGALLDDLS
jgi:hypothetical protein